MRKVIVAYKDGFYTEYLTADISKEDFYPIGIQNDCLLITGSER